MLYFVRKTVRFLVPTIRICGRTKIATLLWNPYNRYPFHTIPLDILDDSLLNPPLLLNRRPLPKFSTEHTG